MPETISALLPSARHLLSEEDFKAVSDLILRDNPGLRPEVAEAVLAEARHLLTDADFDRLVARAVANNPGVDRHLADICADEAIKFWAAAAHRAKLRRENPDLPVFKMLPSPFLDAGWHALLLCTTVAARLSATLGHFTHHIPEVGSPHRNEAALALTQDAIRAAGYEPNPIAWDPRSDAFVKIHGVSMHSECTEGGSACAPPPN
ncbi:hypothetical protein ACWGQT_00075 [Streptomyces yangpuensis]